jgi:hypothetical protein
MMTSKIKAINPLKKKSNNQNKKNKNNNRNDTYPLATQSGAGSFVAIELQFEFGSDIFSETLGKKK